MLLRTTSEWQSIIIIIIIIKNLCFHMVFNNSSLFISMFEFNLN
jgi:hypothetical protein